MDSVSYFLTPFSSASMSMRNRYGLKADRWCNPTSTLKLLHACAVCNSRTLVWQPQYNVLYQSNILFGYVALPRASPDLLPRYLLFAWGCRTHQWCFFLACIQTIAFMNFRAFLQWAVSDQFLVPSRIFCSMWQWASFRPQHEQLRT